MKRILFFAIVAVIGSTGWWACVKLPPDPTEPGGPPDAPKLISPADKDSVDIRKPPLFNWEVSPSTVSYNFRLTTSLDLDDASSIKLDKPISASSVQLSMSDNVMPQNASYYWSVRGIKRDNNGTEIFGPWANARSIKIVRPALKVLRANAEIQHNSSNELGTALFARLGLLTLTECTRHEFVLENTGPGSLRITSAGLQNPELRAFRILDGDGQSQLNKNQTRPLIVRFQPLSDDPRRKNNDIQIKYTEDILKLFVIKLTGLAKEFDIEDNLYTYDFGEHNSSINRVFCLTNEASTSLSPELSFSNNIFSVTPLKINNLGSGDTEEIIITYSASTTGSAGLVIKSSSNEFDTITFKGTTSP